MPKTNWPPRNCWAWPNDAMEQATKCKWKRENRISFVLVDQEQPIIRDRIFCALDVVHRIFLRFGRPDVPNFLRFGRAGTPNFLRFGRSLDSDEFEREIRKPNFIRFGRSIANDADLSPNFLRFGRNVDVDDFNRAVRKPNFLRFG